MKKYEKYYSIMDNCDTYYTALVLDPRVKGKLILRELQDGNAGAMILDTICTTLLKNRSFGNVANGLDLKTNSDDAAKAPRQSSQRGIDVGVLSQARYGPSRTRRTVNRYSSS
jgi:hypothetical protein